eukprot:TRINITY_DN23028_c0_g1_i1.p1 TRINITY_DN23028_c0_g1~~TRINITY_DN23028_c0_g1_i1.p1  ORF type:complete len:347 (-),score=74.07 TRINITY_DN23028_c0_g1_i1:139-1179(-)
MFGFFKKIFVGEENKKDEPRIKEFTAVDFAQAPLNQASVEELPLPWQKLAHLNRYSDIIPNAQTRVRLQRVGNDPATEYINANTIRGIDGDVRYIAAQGPKKESVADFWRMIWEQNSTVAVMLTGLTENGVPKCQRYWPEEVGKGGTIVAGDLAVTLLATEEVGEYVRNELEVRRRRSSNSSTLMRYISCGSSPCETPQQDEAQPPIQPSRHITHFWYNSWPDHGAPASVSGTLDLVWQVRARAEETVDETGNMPPVIVHCSAGIGRTGTFIGIDMGERLLARGETCVDVMELIGMMRRDRGAMVQNKVQADFVRRALVAVAEGEEIDARQRTSSAMSAVSSVAVD